jgi:Rrf2 family iron-sulfur cluster assembly transcriptional regulator
MEKSDFYTRFSSLRATSVIQRAMFRYGKQSRHAVSAMSYLAEKYAIDAAAVSSAEVSRERKISVALAAKLLSQMATAGLTIGTTGPGGGYRLSRPPGKIHLAEIVNLFERKQDEFPCPIGHGSCGTGVPCPLHYDFIRLEENSRLFLEETTLEVFTNKSEGSLKVSNMFDHSV